MAEDRLDQQLERILAARRLSRHRFLRAAGLSGAALGIGAILAA